mmetsp:Transcript_50018/g.57417  ORF Transcript_50018/g.57417 Transcript_50018/m.57417 type:complete len:534 (+) Transcript_50018:1-1602(+)
MTKIWRFIDSHGDLGMLMEGTAFIFKEYDQWLHTLSLFCMSFSHLLIVMDIDELYEGNVLSTGDLARIVKFVAPLVFKFYLNESYLKDFFYKYLCEVTAKLLRTLNDFNSKRQFIDVNYFHIDSNSLANLLDGLWNQKAFATHLIQTIPFAVPFDERVQIFRDMVRHDADQYRFVAPIQMEVRRTHIFEDGFAGLLGRTDLKRRIHVYFINEGGRREEGMDAGGLFKEFWTQLSAETFNPDYGLFRTTPDHHLYPNPQSELFHGGVHLDYFKFLGFILGKAIYESILVEPCFADFFLRKLLGKFNFANDLRSLDPELHNHLQSLKKMEDVEMLYLTFSTTLEGSTEEVDLVPNGRDVEVDNDNKFRYIHALSHFRLNKQIEQQCTAFLRGFLSIINRTWLEMFNERELQMLISGANLTINVQDLYDHTEYSGGYSKSSKQIRNFWQAVESLTEKEKGGLLKFVTSCSRPPLLGFKYLNPSLKIHKVPIKKDGDLLPSASTCFNILYLPTYSSTKATLEKLRMAIHSGAGFEME